MKPEIEHIAFESLLKFSRGELELKQIHAYKQHLNVCEECSNTFKAIKAFETTQLIQPKDTNYKNLFDKFNGGFKYLAAVAACFLLVLVFNIITNRNDYSNSKIPYYKQVAEVVIDDDNLNTELVTQQKSANKSLDVKVNGIHNRSSSIGKSSNRNNVNKVIVECISRNLSSSSYPSSITFDEFHFRHPERRFNISVMQTNTVRGIIIHIPVSEIQYNPIKHSGVDVIAIYTSEPIISRNFSFDVGDLSELKSLYLSDVDFKNCNIPASIANLKKIEKLSFNISKRINQFNPELFKQSSEFFHFSTQKLHSNNTIPDNKKKEDNRKKVIANRKLLSKRRENYS